MAAAKTINLPVIDFSDLKNGTPRRESVKNQVRKALEEYGCFQALYREIPQDLPKSVLDGLRRLFDFPLEIKRGTKSDTPYRGYVGQIPLLPLYESIAVEDVLTLEKVETFTNRFWSQGDPAFRKDSKNMHSFVQKLSELERNVRRVVLDSYGLEKYIDEHMNSVDYVLRCQRYGAVHSHEPELALSPHSDKSFLTIVCQNEVNGSQILTKDGEWIYVEPWPDSFMVFAGDSFHAWTNGALHSVEHRVMMKGNAPRYSTAFFANPKAGYMVKAPEELVDEEHPLLFKPYEYSKFMEFVYTKSGQKSLAILKEYCGA